MSTPLIENKWKVESPGALEPFGSELSTVLHTSISASQSIRIPSDLSATADISGELPMLFRRQHDGSATKTPSVPNEPQAVYGSNLLLHNHAGDAAATSAPAALAQSNLRVPRSFVCPITGALMREPVSLLVAPPFTPLAPGLRAVPERACNPALYGLPDGPSYERAAVAGWLAPRTAALADLPGSDGPHHPPDSPPQLIPNMSLHRAIQHWLTQHGLSHSAADQLLVREQELSTGREQQHPKTQQDNHQQQQKQQEQQQRTNLAAQGSDCTLAPSPLGDAPPAPPPPQQVDSLPPPPQERQQLWYLSGAWTATLSASGALSFAPSALGWRLADGDVPCAPGAAAEAPAMSSIRSCMGSAPLVGCGGHNGSGAATTAACSNALQQPWEQSAPCSTSTSVFRSLGPLVPSNSAFSYLARGAQAWTLGSGECSPVYGTRVFAPPQLPQPPSQLLAQPPSACIIAESHSAGEECGVRPGATWRGGPTSRDAARSSSAPGVLRPHHQVEDTEGRSAPTTVKDPVTVPPPHPPATTAALLQLSDGAGSAGSNSSSSRSQALPGDTDAGSLMAVADGIEYPPSPPPPPPQAPPGLCGAMTSPLQPATTIPPEGSLQGPTPGRFVRTSHGPKPLPAPTDAAAEDQLEPVPVPQPQPPQEYQQQQQQGQGQEQGGQQGRPSAEMQGLQLREGRATKAPEVAAAAPTVAAVGEPGANPGRLGELERQLPPKASLPVNGAHASTSVPALPLTIPDSGLTAGPSPTPTPNACPNSSPAPRGSSHLGTAFQARTESSFTAGPIPASAGGASSASFAASFSESILRDIRSASGCSAAPTRPQCAAPQAPTAPAAEVTNAVEVCVGKGVEPSGTQGQERLQLPVKDASRGVSSGTPSFGGVLSSAPGTLRDWLRRLPSRLYGMRPAGSSGGAGGGGGPTAVNGVGGAALRVANTLHGAAVEGASPVMSGSCALSDSRAARGTARRGEEGAVETAGRLRHAVSSVGFLDTSANTWSGVVVEGGGACSRGGKGTVQGWAAVRAVTTRMWGGGGEEEEETTCRGRRQRIQGECRECLPGAGRAGQRGESCHDPARFGELHGGDGNGGEEDECWQPQLAWPPPPPQELPLGLPLPLQWLSPAQLADSGLSPRDERQAAQQQLARLWRWLANTPAAECKDLFTLQRCMPPGSVQTDSPLRCTYLSCSTHPRNVTVLAVLPPPPLQYTFPLFDHQEHPHFGNHSTPTQPTDNPLVPNRTPSTFPPPPYAAMPEHVTHGGSFSTTYPPTRGAFVLLLTKDRPHHVVIEELPTAAAAGPSWLHHHRHPCVRASSCSFDEEALAPFPSSSGSWSQQKVGCEVGAGATIRLAGSEESGQEGEGCVGRCWAVPSVRGCITAVAACPRGGSLAVGTSAGLVFVWRSFSSEEVQALEAAVPAGGGGRGSGVDRTVRPPAVQAAQSIGACGGGATSPAMVWHLCGRLGWREGVLCPDWQPGGASGGVGEDGGGGGGRGGGGDRSVTALSYDASGSTVFATCRGVVAAWKLQGCELPESLPSVCTKTCLLLTPDSYGYRPSGTPPASDPTAWAASTLYNLDSGAPATLRPPTLSRQSSACGASRGTSAAAPPSARTHKGPVSNKSLRSSNSSAAGAATTTTTSGGSGGGGGFGQSLSTASLVAVSSTPTVTRMAASPSGTHLAFALADGAVHLVLHACCQHGRAACVLLIAAAPQSLMAAAGHPTPGEAVQLAFSQDERRLIVLSLGLQLECAATGRRGGSRGRDPAGCTQREDNQVVGGSGGDRLPRGTQPTRQDNQKQHQQQQEGGGVGICVGDNFGSAMGAIGDPVNTLPVRYALHCFPLTRFDSGVREGEEEEGWGKEGLAKDPSMKGSSYDSASEGECSHTSPRRWGLNDSESPFQMDAMQTGSDVGGGEVCATPGIEALRGMSGTQQPQPVHQSGRHRRCRGCGDVRLDWLRVPPQRDKLGAMLNGLTLSPDGTSALLLDTTACQLVFVDFVTGAARAVPLLLPPQPPLAQQQQHRHQTLTTHGSFASLQRAQRQHARSTAAASGQQSRKLQSLPGLETHVNGGGGGSMVGSGNAAQEMQIASEAGGYQLGCMLVLPGAAELLLGGESGLLRWRLRNC